MVGNKKYIGIDISDHTIEIAVVKRVGFSYEATSFNRVELEEGVVFHGKILEKEKLANLISRLLKNSFPEIIQIRSAIVNISNNYCFFHKIKLSPDVDEMSVEREVKKNIPLPAGNTKFVFQKLPVFENSDNENVVTFSVASEYIRSWTAFFKEININVEMFIPEPIASFNGLERDVRVGYVGVVDMGANSTIVSIFKKGYLVDYYSINTAGNTITENIAKNMDIDQSDALNQKIDINIHKDMGTVSKIIISTLDKIVDEINIYFDNLESDPPKKFYVVGGTARIKGIINYLNSKFSKQEIIFYRGEQTICQNGLAFEYLGAIGLSAWNFKNNHNKNLSFKMIHSPFQGRSVRALFAKFYKSKKIRLYTKYFLGVILCWVLFMSIIFYFNNKLSSPGNISVSPETRSVKQYNYNFDININLTNGEIGSRIIETTIAGPMSFSQAVERGLGNARQEVEDFEKIWTNPLNDFNGSVIFPLSLNWFVYNTSDFEKFVFSVIDEAWVGHITDTYTFKLKRVEKNEEGYKIRVGLDVSSDVENLSPPKIIN